MTHRAKLTPQHEIPSRIDYEDDVDIVYLFDPTLSLRPLTLNHAEATALLYRLAERYPAEVEALVTEWGESKREAVQSAINTAARWCSWCEAPVHPSENYAAHLARHI